MLLWGDFLILQKSIEFHPCIYMLLKQSKVLLMLEKRILYFFACLYLLDILLSTYIINKESSAIQSVIIPNMPTVFKKSFTDSSFLFSRNRVMGLKQNMYAITAAESVNIEIIITGIIYCARPVFTSVLAMKFIVKTTMMIYANATKAFINGFFVITKF